MSSRNYLGAMDAALLLMESKRAPTHIGALIVFKLSPTNGRERLHELVEHMRNQPFLPFPFDRCVSKSKLSKIRPYWVKARMDMDYHVRHSALPAPGTQRELGVLVSRLHSNQLDFSRPLWEAHVIEGLEGDRFAVYFKAHHACIDGMGGMSLAGQWLKTDPDDLSPPGMETAPPPAEISTSRVARLANTLTEARSQARGFADLTRGLARMARNKDNLIMTALKTPRSLFNVPVTRQRRFSPILVELKRIKAVGKAVGVTVNDTVLAIVGGAVRRYLLEQDALPKASLTASVPIGLERPEGGGGNAASGFVTPLGTDIADPIKRLKRINAATTQCKADLASMSREAQDQMALAGLGPLMLGQMSGSLSKRIPPVFNFVVSNVVLSSKKLYLMGAEMEAMFPVSFLTDGYALNVTLVGYAGQVSIGFLGARDAIPHLQRLAIYTRESLEELEQAAGLQPDAAAKGNRPLQAGH